MARDVRLADPVGSASNLEDRPPKSESQARDLVRVPYENGEPGILPNSPDGRRLWKCRHIVVIKYLPATNGVGDAALAFDSMVMYD